MTHEGPARSFPAREVCGVIYRTHDGDMVDAICWRHYGRQSGAVEIVLEANPGLADAGVTLPAGVLIQLPTLPEPRAAQTVRLWD
ncbi:MAG: phage tail protein [Gammaproteobacteria bacterium]|nr:phage tail protein [Gammaproteobacteria bacterium]